MIKKTYIEFLFLIILGIITSLSLPPLNYFVINFFTFSLFFLFLIKKSNFHNNKKLFFFYGWFFGFGYFISSLYWLIHSLTFDEIFKPLIPFALVLIPLFLGIFYGISTLICSLFKLRKKICSSIKFFISYLKKIFISICFK